jgi:hypothetical protein
MKAGSGMKPQKAQVKDKGSGAECWDLRLKAKEISTFLLCSWSNPLKISFGVDWQAIHKVFQVL